MIEGCYGRNIREKYRSPQVFVLLSVGWKLVSLRLSKPVPNSIRGTVQLPKSAPAIVVGGVVVGGAVVVGEATGALVGATVMVLVTVTVIAVWEKQVI